MIGSAVDMTLLDVVARNAVERRDSPALLSLEASPLSHGGLHALVTRTIATLHDGRGGRWRQP